MMNIKNLIKAAINLIKICISKDEYHIEYTKETIDETIPENKES